MSLIHRFMCRNLFLMFLIMPIMPFYSSSLICRSDPIITLSNGMTIILGANITAQLSNVKEAHYELHVPKGVKLVSSIRTADWFKTQETLTVVSDMKSGQYSATVIVDTSVPDVSVLADAKVISATGVELGYYTVAGLEEQPLSLSFSIN